MASQRVGRLPPIDPRLLAANFRGVGDALAGLQPRREPAGGQAVERLEHQPTAELGEAFGQLAGRRIRQDRHRLLQQHRPGVETFVHLHDRNPGLAVAGEDRALDRRRAAPARQ